MVEGINLVETLARLDMEELRLRLAELSDMEFVYELANDSECRKNSMYKKHIEYFEHKEWFAQILKSKERQIFILMVNNESIGQGRIEYASGNLRLSYSLVAQYRGQGYGRKLLQMLMERCRIYYPQAVSIYAEVRKENFASRKIFESLGFEENVGEDICLYRYEI